MAIDDDEIKQLLIELRASAHPLAHKAADEIERLQTELKRESAATITEGKSHART